MLNTDLGKSGRLTISVVIFMALLGWQRSAIAGDDVMAHIVKADGHVQAALKLIAESRSSASQPAADASIQEQRVGELEELRTYLESPKFRQLQGGVQQLFGKTIDISLDAAAARMSLNDPVKAMKNLESTPLRQVSMPQIAAAIASPPFDKLSGYPSHQMIVQRMKAPLLTGSQSPIATRFRPSLSAEEKIAGLSLFWAEVRRSFVHLGSLTDIGWDEAYLKTIPKILAAETTHDYYAVMMTLPAMLRDAHVNIYPPPELKDQFFSRPAIRTALVESKIIVSAIVSERLKDELSVGDEIVEIDGAPADDYAKRFVAPYVSASTEQDRQTRVYSYQLLSGRAGSNVTLTLKDAAGRTKSVQLPRGTGGQESRPEVLELPGSLLYVRLDSFQHNAATSAFHANREKLMAANGLILDLRDNGGGSSQVGYDVLSCLTKAPIPMNRSWERREGGSIRARENVFALQQLEGNTKFEYHKPCPQIFDKQVVVLIGPRTISAAEDFVVSFRALKRGRLIGTATAGSTGQPMQLKLPGGGTARITVKHDMSPDGEEFVGIGIKPDLVVVPSINDFRVGKDATLEFAMRYLKENQLPTSNPHIEARGVATSIAARPQNRR